jgi:hypothetical protein
LSLKEHITSKPLEELNIWGMDWEAGPSDADRPFTWPVLVDKTVALNPFPYPLGHQVNVSGLCMMKNNRQFLMIGPANIICASHALPDQLSKSRQKFRAVGLIDFSRQNREKIGITHGPFAFRIQEKSEELTG